MYLEIPFMRRPGILAQAPSCPVARSLPHSTQLASGWNRKSDPHFVFFVCAAILGDVGRWEGTVGQLWVLLTNWNHDINLEAAHTARLLHTFRHKIYAQRLIYECACVMLHVRWVSVWVRVHVWVCVLLCTNMKSINRKHSFIATKLPA